MINNSKEILKSIKSKEKEKYFEYCLYNFHLRDFISSREKYLKLKEEVKWLKFFYYLRTGKFPGD